MTTNKDDNADLFDFIVTPQRVFLIDWSVYVHRSIFAWRNQKGAIPATYYCLNSVFTCLKRLKPKKDDLVIIAMDSYGKGNWRRDYDPAYKANRKDSRAKQDDIDWSKEFAAMNRLLHNVHLSTPWIPIQVDRLEADDIISHACRHYTDKGIIILTTDSDMNQLYSLGNVKIFSPVNKKIREVKYPLRELTKKIRKETTDNLITPVTTKAEYERRKTIVDLLHLPDEIDEPLRRIFTNLKPKTEYYPDKLMFDSLKVKYDALYKE